FQTAKLGSWRAHALDPAQSGRCAVTRRSVPARAQRPRASALPRTGSPCARSEPAIRVIRPGACRGPTTRARSTAKPPAPQRGAPGQRRSGSSPALSVGSRRSWPRSWGLALDEPLLTLGKHGQSPAPQGIAYRGRWTEVTTKGDAQRV